MLARADADGLPPNDPLRHAAANFERAVDGFYASPQTVGTPSFLSAWAQARRVWCDYTGERLI